MIHIVAKTDDFDRIKHKCTNAILIDLKNNNNIISRLLFSSHFLDYFLMV